MKRQNRKGHITRARNRYAREIGKAQPGDWCYVILKITDGPVHADIQDDWWEQRMDCRSTLGVKFKIADIGGESFIRSECHGCIDKSDLMLSDAGNLRRLLGTLEYVKSSESYIWHFAGKISLPEDIISAPGAAFCEYNAKTRKGFILVTFLERNLPELYIAAPHLLQSVRVLKPGECQWLHNNW